MKGCPLPRQSPRMATVLDGFLASAIFMIPAHIAGGPSSMMDMVVVVWLQSNQTTTT